MRTTTRLFLTAAASLLMVGPAAAQLKLGEVFEGSFPARPSVVPKATPRDGDGTMFVTVLTIELKQDQEVAITVSVEGDRRALEGVLFDKLGRDVAASFTYQVQNSKAKGPQGPQLNQSQLIGRNFFDRTAEGVELKKDVGGGAPGANAPLAPKKAAELHLKQAPRSEKYTLQIMSDKSSKFTVLAVDANAKPAGPMPPLVAPGPVAPGGKRDTAAIRKEIFQTQLRLDELEKELAEAKKREKDGKD